MIKVANFISKYDKIVPEMNQWSKNELKKEQNNPLPRGYLV